MRRSWFKFSLLMLLVVGFVALGSRNNVWASPASAPLGQTVPTRVRSTATPTSNPVEPSATSTLRLATLKPQSTYTLTPTKVTPTAVPSATATKLLPTHTSTHTLAPTVTTIPPTQTASPPARASAQAHMYLPLTGAFLLVLLGVFGVFIWRDRSH
jgi:hypothetical protein